MERRHNRVVHVLSLDRAVVSIFWHANKTKSPDKNVYASCFSYC